MPVAQYPKLMKEAQKLIEEEQLTHKQTAERLGIKSRTTIGRWARKFGWKTQRTGPRSGEKHPCWRGGIRMLKGRRVIYAPNHPNATKQGYVPESRLIMEGMIGRYLTKKEVVHHKDKNRLNNNPSNLQLFSCNGEHLSFELTGHVPKWTPEGWKNIEKGIRKAAAIHRKLKTDEDLRILSTGRLSL